MRSRTKFLRAPILALCAIGAFLLFAGTAFADEGGNICPPPPAQPTPGCVPPTPPPGGQPGQPGGQPQPPQMQPCAPGQQPSPEAPCLFQGGPPQGGPQGGPPQGGPQGGPPQGGFQHADGPPPTCGPPPGQGGGQGEPQGGGPQGGGPKNGVIAENGGGQGGPQSGRGCVPQGGFAPGFANRILGVKATFTAFDESSKQGTLEVSKFDLPKTQQKKFADEIDAVEGEEAIFIYNAQTRVFDADGKRLKGSDATDRIQALVDSSAKTKISVKLKKPSKWLANEDGDPEITVLLKSVGTPASTD